MLRLRSLRRPRSGLASLHSARWSRPPSEDRPASLAPSMFRPLSAVALVCLVAGGATAQQMPGGNVDLQAFRPAIDSKGLITVNASQVLAGGDVSFGLVTTWGQRTLVLGEGDDSYVIDDLITPTLQVAYGIAGRLELGVTVPFHIVSGDSFSAEGIGDVGLHVKVRLLDTTRFPVGVALLGSLYVAGGHEDGRWMGENQLIPQPGVIIDAQLGRLHLASNLGYRPREERTFMAGGETVRAKSELPFGAGASFALVPDRIDLVAEVFGGVPLGGEGYFPLEAAGAVKVYLAQSSYFMIGGGAGLIPGAAANPATRAFLGIVFEPRIGDKDGDGIPDDLDRCPLEPEDKDRYEDLDGCPELDNDSDRILDEDDGCPLDPETRNGIDDDDGCPDGKDLDRDRDGINDDVDGCPDDPEDMDRFQDTDGCPEEDNDGDRILDVDDSCENEPEDFDKYQDDDGCPEEDNDKDGVLDVADKCPVEPGPEDNQGCPRRPVVRRTTGGLLLLDKIYFETGKAVILPMSFPILNAVATTMADNLDIKLMEIQGHADERGDAGFNMTLTQERAEAVRRYLVKKGVAGDRMTAKGYGEDAPIDQGHDEKAWSKNRRVEFVIRKQGGMP
jgi:OmpA-OmpF porin, OOP family